MRRILLASILLLLPSLAQAGDPAPVAQWIQLAPGGGSEVRIVMNAASCPSVTVDGASVVTTERAASNANFAIHLCRAPIAAGAKTASLNGVALPLFHSMPKRIMVFGDTGCRIKGAVVQDCSSPTEWPFPVIAALAAKMKPDLVIHVGDYLYRESPCPAGNAKCAGTPYGDNWPAWAADFFTPAQPLLASSPWVFVRGNHEDCERSGLGWLRLLGPLPVNPVAGCTGHIPLYSVPLGDVNLAVMDDADAPDTSVDSDLRTEYEADFAALAKMNTPPLWLAMHRPIWGAITLFGMDVGGNRTLIAAFTDPHALDRVALMLSGHIHTFEALNYRPKLPPQLVAGFGGTDLDAAPADLAGINLSGTTVKDGLSLGGFGFLMMVRQKTGWQIDVYKVNGTVEERCQYANRRLDCKKA
ncbi:MAG TPA: metallophosphoesterase [Rhizomicrobium sp.]